VPALKGDYKGHCVKGKAEGTGTATGIDTYTGNFKKGYPDGQGKYTWKNGDTFEGEWKQGLFHGEGVLRKHDNTSKDSVLVLKGQWNKGKYLGLNSKPYKVNIFSNNVSNVGVRKNGSGEEILISVKNITGGASTFSSDVLAPKTVLVDIQLVNGMFVQRNVDETSSPIQNKYTLRQVTFPFYAILTFRTIAAGPEKPAERIGVEINEKGSWYVQVSIDN
jgi:hypothetical protein